VTASAAVIYGENHVNKAGLKYPKILAESTHRGNKFVILSRKNSILFGVAFDPGSFDSSLKISTLVVIFKLLFLDDEIESRFFDIILLDL
jgi:hypothetical protein